MFFIYPSIHDNKKHIIIMIIIEIDYTVCSVCLVNVCLLNNKLWWASYIHASRLTHWSYIPHPLQLKRIFKLMLSSSSVRYSSFTHISLSMTWGHSIYCSLTLGVMIMLTVCVCELWWPIFFSFALQICHFFMLLNWTVGFCKDLLCQRKVMCSTNFLKNWTSLRHWELFKRVQS